MHSAPPAARPFPLVVVTGRFQPFHVQHLELVRIGLERSDCVAIGVTNPEPGDRRAHPASGHRHLAAANPFTYAERERAIAAALRADGVPDARFRILPFPLDEPERWPALVPPGTPQLVRVYSDWEREKVRRFDAAGFPAMVLDGVAASRVSGTEIRRRIAAGEDWSAWVPPGAREEVARCLS